MKQILSNGRENRSVFSFSRIILRFSLVPIVSRVVLGFMPSASKNQLLVQNRTLKNGFGETYREISGARAVRLTSKRRLRCTRFVAWKKKADGRWRKCLRISGNLKQNPKNKPTTLKIDPKWRNEIIVSTLRGNQFGFVLFVNTLIGIRLTYCYCQDKFETKSIDFLSQSVCFRLNPCPSALRVRNQRGEKNSANSDKNIIHK